MLMSIVVASWRGLLGGELHTLGYYAINVCVGSPPRPYNLIVDTGSSVTALPCASCTQCGTHETKRRASPHARTKRN